MARCAERNYSIYAVPKVKREESKNAEDSLHSYLFNPIKAPFWISGRGFFCGSGSQIELDVLAQVYFIT